MFYNDYIFQSKVAPTQEALDLSLVKSWLRLDPSDSSEDVILDLLVAQAVEMFEAISRRTLMNSTFITYRDCWESFYELRKSKMVSITELSYVDEDGNTVIVDNSLYYNDISEDYSHLIFTDDFEETVLFGQLDDIKITFIAGLSDTTVKVPKDIQMALLNHILYLYENRGDCDCGGMSAIPTVSLSVYRKYQIIEIGA